MQYAANRLENSLEVKRVKKVATTTTPFKLQIVTQRFCLETHLVKRKEASTRCGGVCFEYVNSVPSQEMFHLELSFRNL